MVFAKWDEMNECSGDVVAVRDVFGKMVTKMYRYKDCRAGSRLITMFLGIMSGSLRDCWFW